MKPFRGSTSQFYNSGSKEVWWKVGAVIAATSIGVIGIYHASHWILDRQTNNDDRADSNMNPLTTLVKMEKLTDKLHVCSMPTVCCSRLAAIVSV
jgi:hypothetical protein